MNVTLSPLLKLLRMLILSDVFILITHAHLNAKPYFNFSSIYQIRRHNDGRFGHILLGNTLLIFSQLKNDVVLYFTMTRSGIKTLSGLFYKWLGLMEFPTRSVSRI